MTKLKESTNKQHKTFAPALTPDGRENQMIALAIDLAEKQLIKGNASSQTINHYLKLASSKDRIEKEILEKQKELLVAKTEAIKSANRVEELYKNALDAMRSYSASIMQPEVME